MTKVSQMHMCFESFDLYFQCENNSNNMPYSYLYDIHKYCLFTQQPWGLGKIWKISSFIRWRIWSLKKCVLFEVIYYMWSDDYNPDFFWTLSPLFFQYHNQNAFVI